MKLFQLNLLAIFLLLASIALLVVLPSFLIQGIWNSFTSQSLEHDFRIELWQASLLWGALITVLHMFGVFSFKINFKTLESIDLDSISDPELRSELEKLKKEKEQQDKQD